jgi:glutaredoxin
MAAASTDDVGDVRRTVEEKPVVVVGLRGCCMVHVARRLLLGQGANPAVLEVGDDADPAALVAALRSKDISTRGVADVVVDACGAAATARHAAFPAVFIGGRLVGGLDRLMSMHIAGELVPVLKQAGALWL